MEILNILNYQSLQEYCEEESFLHLLRPSYKITILITTFCTIVYNSNLILATSFCLIIIIIILFCEKKIQNFLQKFYGIFALGIFTFCLTLSIPSKNLYLYNNITSLGQVILYKFSSQVITLFSLTIAIKLTIGIFLSLSIPKLFSMGTNPEALALPFNRKKLLLLKLENIIFAFILAFELMPLLFSKLNEILVAFKIRGTVFRNLKIYMVFECIELTNELLTQHFLKNAQYLSTSLKIRAIFSLELKYLNTTLKKLDLFYTKYCKLIQRKYSYINEDKSSPTLCK
uniref:Energy-coupling factor transporter transmembrane protein EcfT-like n=1 Tax=Sciadococcus taiwanensis TaxID=3028030 RepID=A0A9Y1I266_9RHOD|nr:Energy-coupling factor transporter transmembrane protein EcfT-like [Sciadococcus taiwanensis]